MEPFYVNLFSNVLTSRESRSNSLARFNSLLAAPLKFDEEFEVGLSEISFTNSWYNVVQDALIVLVSVHNDEYLSHSFLAAGRYESHLQLIDACNREIKKQHETIYEDGTNAPSCPSLHFDSLSGLVRQDQPVGARVKIYFDDSLRGMLGALISPQLTVIRDKLPRDNLFCWSNSDKTKCLGIIKEAVSDVSLDIPNHGDISGGITSVLVYTDIIRHGIVGDIFAPLLKAVHIGSDTQFFDQINRSYDSPEFRPLATREISQISISLHDNSGRLIPFKFGRVRCTLIFRPRKYGSY